MIKPLPSNVLLVPVPQPTQTAGGIHLLDKGFDGAYNAHEWVILNCGSKVPFDLQPGMRVIIDPGSLAAPNFEYQGLLFKTTNWKNVKMVLDAPAAQ